MRAIFLFCSFDDYLMEKATIIQHHTEISSQRHKWCTFSVPKELQYVMFYLI